MKLVITDHDGSPHSAFFDLRDEDYQFYFINDREFEEHLTQNNGIEFAPKLLSQLSLATLESMDMIQIIGDMNISNKQMSE